MEWILGVTGVSRMRTGSLVYRRWGPVQIRQTGKRLLPACELAQGSIAAFDFVGLVALNLH